MKSKRFSLPDVDWRVYVIIGCGLVVLAIWVESPHLAVGLLFAAVATFIVGVLA